MVGCLPVDYYGDDLHRGVMMRSLGRPGAAERKAVMGTRLFVGNLPFSTSEDSLRELFSPYGEVVECHLVTDKFSGRSRGFGFVQMGTQDGANKAIVETNGKEIDGRKLTVNEARPREERPDGDRGGRSNGGFRERRSGGRERRM